MKYTIKKRGPIARLGHMWDYRVVDQNGKMYGTLFNSMRAAKECMKDLKEQDANAPEVSR